MAEYLGRRTPLARYSSFDYCYNYFRASRDAGTASALAIDPGRELSCLHLGFYLASWGMLRGSSTLLKRSVAIYSPVIDVIAATDLEFWAIDAGSYDDDVCTAILSKADAIRAALPNGASDILVTKIMLGVFGCVPAFDTNFKRGFGVSRFGREALRRVDEYCRANANAIARHRVATLDFATGRESTRVYTCAKVIDMVFFVEGMRAIQ